MRESILSLFEGAHACWKGPVDILPNIDGTKLFQNKTKENVDKGRQFLKKSVAQLEQYNETKKKI